MTLHLWSHGFTGFQGGIGAFSRELAMGLRDLGHTLRLIGRVDVPGTWNGFPLWGAGKWPLLLQTPAFAAGAFAACARHRPEHLISTHVNYAPVAHWVKRALGIPFTVVTHGLDLDRLNAARRAALRAADRVVAVSTWTRQRVLDVGGIDVARISVLPNTVDEERFTLGVKPQALVNRYKLGIGQKVLLTVGRLVRSEGYKGYDRLVQALSSVQAACGAVRFLIAGQGDDRPRLEAMVNELGLEKLVTFIGFVPDDELADHYRLADVFAMPSTREGFGVVFLEAMACGTPVLAGNCDGSVDALDGGRLGRLVDPTDPGAIAEGIISLLKQDGPQWWFERQALRDAVIERFGRTAFRESLRTALGGASMLAT